MMLSVRAWRALQAQNLNLALAKILRKLLEASDMQHDAMMDVFKPRDNSQSVRVGPGTEFESFLPGLARKIYESLSGNKRSRGRPTIVATQEQMC